MDEPDPDPQPAVDEDHTAVPPSDLAEAVDPLGRRLLALAAAPGVAAWALVPWSSSVVRLGGWALGSLVVMSLLTVRAVRGASRGPGHPLPGPAALWRPAVIAVVGVAAAALHAYAFATELTT